MTAAPRELRATPPEATIDIREFMSKVGRHKWLIIAVAAFMIRFINQRAKTIT